MEVVEGLASLFQQKEINLKRVRHFKPLHLQFAQ